MHCIHGEIFCLIAGELENCSFLFADFKFRQNVSPCNTKQNKFKTDLILSVSESARAKLAPPTAFFSNYFFNGFFHFFSNVTFNSLITFLSSLFSGGNTTIGSKICESPFSANGANTSIVEPGAHFGGGVAPGWDFSGLFSFDTGISSLITFNSLITFGCGGCLSFSISRWIGTASAESLPASSYSFALSCPESSSSGCSDSVGTPSQGRTGIRILWVEDGHEDNDKEEG